MAVQKVTRKPKGIFILTGIIVLLISMVLVIQAVLDPFVEQVVKEQIGKIFGDRLEIGTVHTALWRGALVINDVNLLQPPGFSQGSLLKAKRIRAQMALKPLLNRELIVKNIIAVAPEINLIQRRDGSLNTEYYLTKFSQPAQGEQFKLQLQNFMVKNGKLTFSSPGITSRRPAFSLAKLDLNINNIIIPNPQQSGSPFKISGLILSAHPCNFRAFGTGNFGGQKLSFNFNSKIDGLWLTDYAYLFPDSQVKISSGRAWVSSQAKCTADYLNSYHQVSVKGLKIASKKGGPLGGTLIGVPANTFVKAIQDKNGNFDFDFRIDGYWSSLRVDLKQAISNAVSKSIRAKLGLGFEQIEQMVVGGLKQAGNKVKQTFKNIFKK